MPGKNCYFLLCANCMCFVLWCFINVKFCVNLGGGINERNIERILEQTSAKEFHCSARTSEQSLMEFRNNHG